MYKVLISCAGTGSRVSNYSNGMNKSLISIDKKPVISHIIDKIPKDIEIIICLGYEGETLKEYLMVTYFDRNMSFVDVDNFDGPGSGLGYSISKAKHLLQCPFIFISNDTLFDTIIEPLNNYVLYSDRVNCSNYRTVSVNGNILSSLNEKGVLDNNPYIGVCGIKDYNEFWKYNKQLIDNNLTDIGESYSIIMMNNNGINFLAYKETRWFDTGNEEELKITETNFTSNSNINVLDKHNERIWILDDRIVKYHSDPKFISDRIERAEILSGYVPKIIKHSKHFYSYDRFNGDTLSNQTDENIFYNFLDYIKSFWGSPLDYGYNDDWKTFYYDKTCNRLSDYVKRYPMHDDQTSTIFELNDLKIFELISKVDWTVLSTGSSYSFHGDLHFENILFNGSDFKLIDWRQNFGNSKLYGDIYYDLSKLKHGMIVSHHKVLEEKFSFTNNSFNIETTEFNDKCIKILDKWIIENNYSLKKVNIITALIYLNVASLHHNPYDKFLFTIGKYLLAKEII